MRVPIQATNLYKGLYEPLSKLLEGDYRGDCYTGVLRAGGSRKTLDTFSEGCERIGIARASPAKAWNRRKDPLLKGVLVDRLLGFHACC